MPIRTHRGRAAVYRTFWGWPVRSPRHLIGTVLVFAVLGGGMALLLPDEDNEPAVATPSSSARARPLDPPSRAVVPEPRPFPDISPPSPTAPDSAPAPPEALAVADAWMRAFLTTPEGIDSVRWAEQMRPYTAEEILPILQSIDPANVPEAQVVGEPRTVSSGAGKAEVDVSTTAGVVRLLLVPTPEGWRVADFDKVG